MNVDNLAGPYPPNIVPLTAQPEAFEACAKIAEQIASQYSDGRGHAAERVANAIRHAAAKGTK